MRCSIDGIKNRTRQLKHLLQEMDRYEIVSITIKIINLKFMDRVKFHWLTECFLAK